ncbi:preprotein translocase subunit SecE [Candidatus Calescamantes bacterium]|nr:preprotein translocase subunit SecE [Candidatus Calescamantes bacterium]
MFGRLKKYFQEVKGEMRRVAWSEKRVLWTSTFLVIVVSLLIALYLGVVDLLINRLITTIIR